MWFGQRVRVILWSIEGMSGLVWVAFSEFGLVCPANSPDRAVHLSIIKPSHVEDLNLQRHVAVDFSERLTVPVFSM
jgi:hypothetical protein